MAKRMYTPTTKANDKKIAAKKRKKLSGISGAVKSGNVAYSDGKGYEDGDEWWTWRSSMGKDKIFTSPQSMFDAINTYFQKTKSRPYKKEEWKTTKYGLKKVSIDVTPPFTWEALCLFLGVSLSYFRTFKCTLNRSDPRADEYLAVIEMADQIIRSQKYEGAAVGKYKENLIAYDLGLKKDNVQASSEGGLTINIESTKTRSLIEEVKRQLDEIDNQNDGKKKVN